MTRWVIATTTAIVGIIGADIADAQVTPEDVWQSWQKMTASYGQALVADSVTRDGDTLVASGITASMDQDGASMVGKIDEMRFRDLGDGLRAPVLEAKHDDVRDHAREGGKRPAAGPARIRRAGSPRDAVG